MKKIMMAIVMMVSAGAGHASDFGSLAVGADILKAAAAGAALPVNGSQTPVDGWLDGGYHAHEAPDPQGSVYKYVLYATLVKAEGTLYLQAFAPGKLGYLANFKTSPKAAVEDLGTLRSDQGNPYLVAFAKSSHNAEVKTNMLVVEFNSKQMFRFAITRSFPASDIENGKFKRYVPSDSDSGAWSPWIEVR